MMTEYGKIWILRKGNFGDGDKMKFRGRGRGIPRPRYSPKRPKRARKDGGSARERSRRQWIETERKHAAMHAPHVIVSKICIIDDASRVACRAFRYHKSITMIAMNLWPTVQYILSSSFRDVITLSDFALMPPKLFDLFFAVPVSISRLIERKLMLKCAKRSKLTFHIS